MINTSQIVHGGGWKEKRVERIKVKAWVMLFTAIALGGLAMVGSDPLWLYLFVPAGLSLVASLLFFVWEKPREISFPGACVGQDPRKLYAASGQPHEKENIR